jgi:hypothetical protein
MMNPGQVHIHERNPALPTVLLATSANTIPVPKKRRYTLTKAIEPTSGADWKA